jgi:hypothetical protein
MSSGSGKIHARRQTCDEFLHARTSTQKQQRPQANPGNSRNANGLWIKRKRAGLQQAIVAIAIAHLRNNMLANDQRNGEEKHKQVHGVDLRSRQLMFG